MIVGCGGPTSTAAPPPAAPTGVVASAGNGQVTLTWTASVGATSYNIYWSTSSNVSKSGGMRVTAATSGNAVAGLTNGSLYYFVVTAENASGESSESSSASATPEPPAPGAPIGVLGAAGNGQVTLSWTSSSGATSYNAYWSTSASVSKSAGTKIQGIASGDAVTGLTNGTTYYFVVTAVNGGGESPDSSPAASAIPEPPPPAAPTSVLAAAGNGQVTLSWTASSGATSYDAYWSTSASVSKSTGTKIQGIASGDAVIGLTNGTTYYFVVTAVNGGGESPDSSPAAAATPVPPIPAVPAGMTAVAGDGKVTVSWTLSSGANSYNVYWSTSSSVSKTSGTKVANAVSGDAVTGLSNGTSYHFIVTAVNLGGESAASSPAAMATPAAIPLAPTSVTAVAGEGEAIVSWTASSGATSYNVYWSPSATVSKTNGTKVAAAVNGGSITGLPAGVSSYFVVTAVNASGESADSSPAATATPLPILLGTFAYSGAGGTDMAVNSSSKQVYISGGMGQAGLIRVNASNPASMSQTTLSNGGGVAADNQTGRYATTDGYGGHLNVYNSNDTLYDSQTISGCGGSLTGDSITGRFFISSQCNDHIAVYSEGSKSLLANIANNGVGSLPVFDPGTGNIFENLTPNHGNGNVVAPLVVSSSYATSLPFTGFVMAADGAIGHLYVGANNGDFRVLNSSTFATLHTFPGTSFSSVVADTSLSLFYAASGSTITVYDANTYAQITSLTLPSTIQNMKMVPGDKRLYAIDGSKLYVIQTQGSGPAAPTGVTAVAGPGQATISWTASSGATSYNVYWSTSATVSKANGTKVAGAVSGGTITGLAIGVPCNFVVTAVDLSGESAESSPAATATPSPIVLGTYSYSGAGGTDLAVNSASKQVYISGGMGQQGLIRVNASNPSSMSQSTLSYGGGVAADSQTGRYATTDAYSGHLYIYNSDDSLYDSQTISGCGGSLTGDPATGRFFVSSQCSDHIAVYSEGSKLLVANIAAGGTGSVPVFDPGTGNLFENLTPNYNKGSVVAPLVVSSSYATSLPITGFVMAADGALGRLYVSANNGDFLALNSSTYSTLHTFSSTSFSSVVADTSLGLFYVASGSTIKVYDANSYAQVNTLTLSGAIQNMKMVPGDSRLYAIDGSRLYVIQTE